ncbi:MAG: GNAT family N-acetyltransferase [Chryseobacterium sp.]|jgi:GNAT superfamily N-acetyltransferase|uniref:GNAT family N-acetyltransferase n=1 Tax=Chryseobacterium sp. TaxID=1871047 RepID=UPI002829B143|nr:GNAT family N-acetyltransferase [Chryseobacterium sp.]MDR2235218.1 GNAT family N-acetyltransferase [Chryseobacterium sp.]
MTTIDLFSPAVQTYWKQQFEGRIIHTDQTFILCVNDRLAEDSQVMTLEFPDGTGWAVISPKVLEILDPEQFEFIDLERFIGFLKQNQITLHGADYVFYFPESEKKKLAEQTFPESTRLLTPDDRAFFTAFEAGASEQDLDDAYVELDHWKVGGTFENNRLASAASIYPWETGSFIADMGVLTLHDFRGKGYAAQTVQAISKMALQEGYEPQYRCQLDNESSVALAQKLKLTFFAKWNVISRESTEKLSTEI